MKTIHLSTEDGKNARVPLLKGKKLEVKTVKVTSTEEEIVSTTIHRGNANVDLSTLTAQDLITGDPEIDMENIGKFIPETSKAYRMPGSDQMEGQFQKMIVTYTPDGEFKEKTPYSPKKANINDTAPIKMGKRMPLAEVFQRFAFHNQYSLGHEDGIQHDFLLSIAKELEAKQEAALLGGGPKGNLPLVLRDGGTPTRAFLIGETDGEKYRLRVLLTRQELKVPEPPKAETTAAE